MKHRFFAKAALFGLSLGGALLTAPAALAGEGSPASIDENEAVRLQAEALELQQGGPASAPAFGTIGSAVQIETSEGETQATLVIGFQRSRPGKTREANGIKTVSTVTDSYSVTASAPLGKNGNPSIFDIDKLGDGTSIEVKGVRYWGSARFRNNDDPNSMQRIDNNRTGRCIYGESDKWAARQGDYRKAQKANTGFRTALAAALDKAQNQYDPALRQVADSAEGDVKELAIALFSCIGAAENPTLASAEDYTLASERAAIRSLRGSGLWFLGVSGKVSRTNYEYVVQTPLAGADISHTNYRLQAFGGKVFASGRVSANASFGYTRTHKPNDPVKLCEPNGIGAQIACFEGPLGAPVRADRYTLAGEVRWKLPLPMISRNAAIGFAPRVSYELESKSTLIELPIYFAPAKGKSALTGGLRMGYDTKSDDFAIGLFIGVPFSIFYD